MARSQESDVSVYDFIYVDARRISVLSSQLSTDGDLTELERNTETSDDLGAGFDVKLVKMDQKSQQRSSLRQRFDPQWLAPLRFLEAAADLLERDLSKAGIGQLVLATGKLRILDLGTMKTLIEIPLLKKFLLGSNTPPAGPRQSKKQEPDATAIGMAMMPAMPHVIQARLSSGNVSFWASLSPEGLLISPGDLVLKHGVKIAGDWSVVGILDAVPDEELSAIDEMAAQITDLAELGAYVNGLAQLAPAMRPILGRPAHAFGITPLLIFREIKR